MVCFSYKGQEVVVDEVKGGIAQKIILVLLRRWILESRGLLLDELGHLRMSRKGGIKVPMFLLHQQSTEHLQDTQMFQNPEI